MDSEEWDWQDCPEKNSKAYQEHLLKTLEWVLKKEREALGID